MRASENTHFNLKVASQTTNTALPTPAFKLRKKLQECVVPKARTPPHQCMARICQRETCVSRQKHEALVNQRKADVTLQKHSIQSFSCRNTTQSHDHKMTPHQTTIHLKHKNLAIVSEQTCNYLNFNTSCSFTNKIKATMPSPLSLFQTD